MDEVKSHMNSRERVRRAIHFTGPDRLPHYLPDGGENDILWLWLDLPSDRQAWTPLPDGRQRKIDAWGVTWETMGGGSFGEAMAWPLADITMQSDYPLPDINNFAYFDTARAFIEANAKFATVDH